METVTWIIIGIATLILLAIYWGRKNAVWGGFTIGIIIGLIMMLFSGFNLYVIGKGAALGTLIGFAAELLGKVSDFIKRKK
jgi:hypothetical protein